jgi:hypothetical protein
MLSNQSPLSLLSICSIAIFSVLLNSCSQDPVPESHYFKSLVLRKTGLNLNDSIRVVSNEDVGIDLHGTISQTYSIDITDADLQHWIDKIEIDTIHKWIKSDSTYMLIVYPIDIHDTLFGFSLLKSNAIMRVQIFR